MLSFKIIFLRFFFLLRAAISQATARQHAWVIPPVACPADNKFYAQIGPAGGKKGYQAITGHVGWGIAWYINGLMIPELYVQRGVTYTFIIEGGNNKTHTSKNHPFYITSDPTGGYEHKSQAERRVSVCIDHIDLIALLFDK